MASEQKETTVIDLAVMKMRQNKLVSLDKAYQYVRAAVISLKAYNKNITPGKLYNAALGQGGWRE